MSRHIFTYGSLMFAPVWQRVVRGQYRHEPACVANYARLTVRGATYPGMIAQPGGTVSGLVYFDVDEPDLLALDAFEGSDYRREVIEILLESGLSTRASTYIYLRPERLEAVPWRPEQFQLQRFLRDYCGE